MTADIYLAYLLTCAVFFATPPGPSQALMIANSLRHGLRPSLATLAGDLSANAVQMSVAAFGLAAVLAGSAMALTMVKWAGVAYLAWMGVRTWRAPPPDLSAAGSKTGAKTDAKTGAKSGAGRARLYRQGFLTSAANPKAVFFFAALFPQFIAPEAPVLPQLLVLGATYLAIDGALLLAYGALAERLLRRFRARLAMKDVEAASDPRQ